MELLELRNAIDRADQIYFGGGHPPDDSVYDGWKRELRNLCPDDERLTRVGAPVPAESTQEKVAHVHPMGSLNNAMNVEEFMAWHNRILDAAAGLHVVNHHAEQRTASQIRAAVEETLRYNLSFKMDGGSAALLYNSGVLVRAITRGDGTIGEDITANVLRMTGVPRYVTTVYGTPFNGSIRGEIMLFNKEWKTLDPDQLSNPRNLGNGISRRSDGEDCEHLWFVAFRVFTEDGFPMDQLYNPKDPRAGTESGMLETSARMGFTVVTHLSHQTAENVISFYNAMQGNGLAYALQATAGAFFQSRDTLPFEIDGLVVKAESLELQAAMGESGNCPKSMIAFKFPPRGAETKILDVEITVGHTGAIIPTAVLKAVKIGGVTVSRALLCNWDEIDRLGVAIGDTVQVVRRGDVIPKIVAKIADGGRRQPILKPTVCPVTGGPVGHRTNVDGTPSAVLYSLSPNNPAVLKGKIERWVKSLDIQGLGETFISELVDRGVLKDVADLYTLWAPVRRFELESVLGYARAASVLEEIDKKQVLTLAEFLGSLGIHGLGKRRVALVQAKDPGQFNTLGDWTSGKLVTRAAEAGLPKAAPVIQQQIKDAEQLIAELQTAGVKIMEKTEVAPVKAGALTFCLTGKFSSPKAFYHERITAAGHRFEESYRKGLSFLVAADPSSNSAKLKKAEKDGVSVISDTKLLEMLQ